MTVMTSRPADSLPRSTAYYYGDLERIKRNVDKNELSEYLEANDVTDITPIREVPPLRDRFPVAPVAPFQHPLSPEDRATLQELSRLYKHRHSQETYSTAGTFRMPEPKNPKEKEPLLAELEVVGRLPLDQLSGSGVRSSRSWFCCPNVEEEISQESSWRYSSLRPVTAPPVAQRSLSLVSGSEDPASLRAERDALARALCAERNRSANAARAHDARLAELHGVIAELVRRRAVDRHAEGIPEEFSERSDECESTTQPAGDLEKDTDLSKTDQNDSSSLLSPAELPTPQDEKDSGRTCDDLERETSSLENCDDCTGKCEKEIGKSEERLYPNDERWCLSVPKSGDEEGGSCDRERGSLEEAKHNHAVTASPAISSSRHAKLASRVRLKRSGDQTLDGERNEWCYAVAERVAADVGACADLGEALHAANTDVEAVKSALALCRRRCERLEADCRLMECAKDRAAHLAHRLWCSLCAQETSCVSLWCALAAADRALETYDVLLALAETSDSRDHTTPADRANVESVARKLLARLDSGPAKGSLQSPGPWLDTQSGDSGGHLGPGWGPLAETRLRAHAARLKAETATLREHHPPHHLAVQKEELDETILSRGAACDPSDNVMETAVLMQEVAQAREERAAALAALAASRARARGANWKTEPCRRKNDRAREPHWLERETPRPSSETQL